MKRSALDGAIFNSPVPVGSHRSGFGGFEVDSQAHLHLIGKLLQGALASIILRDLGGEPSPHTLLPLRPGEAGGEDSPHGLRNPLQLQVGVAGPLASPSER